MLLAGRVWAVAPGMVKGSSETGIGIGWADLDLDDLAVGSGKFLAVPVSRYSPRPFFG